MVSDAAPVVRGIELIVPCSTENQDPTPLTPTRTRTTRPPQRPLTVTPLPHGAGLVPGALLAPAPMETAPMGTPGATTGAPLLTAAGAHPLPDAPRFHWLVIFLSLLQASVYAYKSKQQPNPSNVLGVFGLSIRTQERDLEDEFSRYGRVEKVTIVYDQRVSHPYAPLWHGQRC